MDKLQEKWNQLSQFVKETCKDRDDSHGYQHMKTVADTSLIIFVELYGLSNDNLEFAVDVITVAWLHDVADHKYEKGTNLKETLKTFLGQFSPDKCDLIINIIDRISFSKENSSIMIGKKLDWNDVLGEYGCKIRDIVSDSDKLEAIGRGGIERFIEYHNHTYANKYNKEQISYELMIKKLKEHADEKLLRIKDEFIRTIPGKRFAEIKHKEMVEELNKL